ncbi:hypothetical protein NM208_g1977 [Fusarium decemcellulare]|uniref:Uncharacterized protein n=1 Tax=Fusarium decemcellulare TaxID=57161 RepID=A0ACC1SU11_9HYPO|nr:hypothetical protein NM208_g1977 [Fusarium decemcellulare]
MLTFGEGMLSRAEHLITVLASILDIDDAKANMPTSTHEWLVFATCRQNSAHDIPDSGSTGPALFSNETSPEEKVNAVKLPRETTSLVDDLKMGNAADVEDAAGDEEVDRAEAGAKDEISEISFNISKLVAGMDSIDLEDP